MNKVKLSDQIANSNPEANQVPTATEEALKSVASKTDQINYQPEVPQHTVPANQPSQPKLNPPTQVVLGKELKVGDIIVLNPHIKGRVTEVPTRAVNGNVRSLSDGRYFALFPENKYKKIATE